MSVITKLDEYVDSAIEVLKMYSLFNPSNSGSDNADINSLIYAVFNEEKSYNDVVSSPDFDLDDILSCDLIQVLNQKLFTIRSIKGLKFKDVLGYIMERFKRLKNESSLNKVSLKQLVGDSICEDTNVDLLIGELVQGVLYIEVYKRIAKVLSIIVCFNYKDIKFVNSVRCIFKNDAIFNGVRINSYFEKMFLLFGIDFDKYPDLTLEDLKRCDGFDMDNFIFEMVTKTIDKLSDLPMIDKDPEDVYYYMYCKLYIDVLLSHLSYGYLIGLQIYCQLLPYSNNYIRYDMCALVKKYMKKD